MEIIHVKLSNERGEIIVLEKSG